VMEVLPTPPFPATANVIPITNPFAQPVHEVKIIGVFGEGSGEALFAKRASPVTLHKIP
jgi:hypothetical protein